MTMLRAALVLLAVGSVAACDGTPTADPSTDLSPAVQGCLRDVGSVTGNSQVAVVAALESEAGTEVTVGVGPEMAPWRCIGYADGTTTAIMSLTDEGAL